MIISTIRANSQLWIDPDPSADLSDSLARINAANLARDDMLAGVISVDDWLDVLSDLGLDPDLVTDGLDAIAGAINGHNSSPRE